ncbi:prepilin-type N-terminal cleavage/methylation domain-containing protein [Lysobacter sp. N42]|uniref:prepilin-type N-terminal cleavage/methylation domain-containing protein n=1 Tax=Lysobacter sp. N42 TaxID=2545719 RepID=UPI00104E46F5|nr:prepilin-type N-terminal cleavage/methylation domain-containing protein [Lysobacter sp. N42]TCZ84589.1 prepilin-type N-terminal cleavage/methylation domain-containing protein [Lysobacter sp. N42]
MAGIGNRLSEARAACPCARNVGPILADVDAFQWHRPRIDVHLRNDGFSLVEMMVVVAIIALLAAIALPVLSRQQVRAAETACLSETRTYVTMTLAAMASGATPQAHPRRACTSGDDITADSISVAASPRPPGTRQSVCLVATSTCALE